MYNFNFIVGNIIPKSVKSITQLLSKGSFKGSIRVLSELRGFRGIHSATKEYAGLRVHSAGLGFGRGAPSHCAKDPQQQNLKLLT